MGRPSWIGIYNFCEGWEADVVGDKVERSGGGRLATCQAPISVVVQITTNTPSPRGRLNSPTTGTQSDDIIHTGRWDSSASVNDVVWSTEMYANHEWSSELCQLSLSARWWPKPSAEWWQRLGAGIGRNQFILSGDDKRNPQTWDYHYSFWSLIIGLNYVSLEVELF